MYKTPEAVPLGRNELTYIKRRYITAATTQAQASSLLSSLLILPVYLPKHNIQSANNRYDICQHVVLPN